MSAERIKLREVPTGGAFITTNPEDNAVYEHRGNGWHQVWASSETGGPWHMSPDTIVIVDPAILHPSQQLSCFV